MTEKFRSIGRGRIILLIGLISIFMTVNASTVQDAPEIKIEVKCPERVVVNELFSVEYIITVTDSILVDKSFRDSIVSNNSFRLIMPEQIGNKNVKLLYGSSITTHAIVYNGVGKYAKTFIYMFKGLTPGWFETPSYEVCLPLYNGETMPDVEVIRKRVKIEDRNTNTNRSNTNKSKPNKPKTNKPRPDKPEPNKPKPNNPKYVSPRDNRLNFNRR